MPTPLPPAPPLLPYPPYPPLIEDPSSMSAARGPAHDPARHVEPPERTQQARRLEGGFDRAAAQRRGPGPGQVLVVAGGGAGELAVLQQVEERPLAVGVAELALALREVVVEDRAAPGPREIVPALLPVEVGDLPAA